MEKLRNAQKKTRIYTLENRATIMQVNEFFKEIMQNNYYK